MKINRLASWLVMVIFMIPLAAQADDLDIFGAVKLNVEPNILIIFDNSGSMKDPVAVKVPIGAYDPDTQYSNPSSKFRGRYVYQLQSDGTYHSDEYFVNIGDDNYVDSDEIRCDAFRSALNTDGYHSGNIRTEDVTVGRRPNKITYEKGSCEAGDTYSGINYVTLATGNYLIWKSLAGYTTVNKKKIDVAKETVNNLIASATGVRFGVMVFSSPYSSNSGGQRENGGYVLAPVKDRDATKVATLKSLINSISANTSTPLAETLAEAGLYFAGKKSWVFAMNAVDDESIGGDKTSDVWTSFSTGIYKSPIQYRCQPNYVIIMTDGMPTADWGSSGDPLTSILTGSWDGWQIKDYDRDGGNDYDNYPYRFDYYGNVTQTVTRRINEVPGSDVENVDDTPDKGHYYVSDSYYYGGTYLDDVAAFLYKTDLRSGIDSASGEDFDKDDFTTQNIKTYTIGFDTSNSLLEATADSAHGHGRYFSTKDDISLADIFSAILTDVFKRSAQFISPIVPVNRSNKTYADNSMYVCVFKPDSSGQWLGNLKKFALSDDGIIVDRDGNVATKATDADSVNGTIQDTAHSAWNDDLSGKEGLAVDKGGAGQALLLQASTSRKFYTNKNLVAGDLLAKCELSPSNTALTYDDFNLVESAYASDPDSYKKDLIDYVCGQGKYSPTDDKATNKRSWLLGDIIHSRPAILRPSTQNKITEIFVGANDGFLHCLIDDDGGTTEVSYDKITNKYSTPLIGDTLTEAWAFMPWELAPNLKKLPPVGATSLAGDSNHDYFVDGCPLVYHVGDSDYVVFGLRGGGSGYYCLNVTDYANPKLAWAINSDILGATAPLGQSWVEPHVINVKTKSDDVRGTKLILLAGGYDTNQNSESTAAIDSKGCSVFAVNAVNGTLSDAVNFYYGAVNDAHAYNKLTHCIVDLKAYDHNDDGFDDTIYAPSLGGELFCFNDRDGDGQWTNRLELFNTGQNSTQKFFYAPSVVQMSWGDYVYIGSGNREDPQDTDVDNYFYCIPNTWNMELSPEVLAQNKGWYFPLKYPGEKCVSSPIVYAGYVFFTTFTPTTDDTSSSSGEEDKCSSGVGAGVARLYFVNYKTGKAIKDLNNDGKVDENDRSKVIGSGMPTQPVVMVTKSKVASVSSGSAAAVASDTTISVAADGQLITFDPKIAQTFVPYYWKQL